MAINMDVLPLFFLVLCVVSVRGVSVSWGSSTSSSTILSGVDIGGSATISCVSADHTNSANEISITKSIGQVSHTVATGNVMGAPYDALGPGRYSASYNYNSTAQSATLTLYIFGVKGNDGGHFTCRLTDAEDQYATLPVLGGASSTYMYGTKDGEVIPLLNGSFVTIGEDQQVGCYTEVYFYEWDASVDAIIRVTVDDKLVYTDAVVMMQRAENDTMGRPIFPRGYNETYYIQPLDPNFIGKTFKCVVYTGANEADNQTLYATVVMDSLPFINCVDETTFSAPKGQQAIRKCNVTSYPKANITWTYGTMGNETDIPTAGKFVIEETVLDPITVLTVLTINNVEEDMFAKMFTVSAVNDQGDVSVSVALTEGHISGQSVLAGCWPVVMFTMMFWSYMHYI